MIGWIAAHVKHTLRNAIKGCHHVANKTPYQMDPHLGHAEACESRPSQPMQLECLGEKDWGRSDKRITSMATGQMA